MSVMKRLYELKKGQTVPPVSSWSGIWRGGRVRCCHVVATTWSVSVSWVSGAGMTFDCAPLALTEVSHVVS